LEEHSTHIIILYLPAKRILHFPTFRTSENILRS